MNQQLSCLTYSFTVPGSSPEELRSVEVTSRSAVLTWDPPPYEDQNGVTILYIINVTVQEMGEMFQLNSTTTTLTVTGLKPFRTYVCVIAAATSVGLGPFSAPFTVETLQDG